MEIRNKTKFKTPHLRAFVNKISKLELEPQDKRRLVVEVVPSREYVSGCYYSAYHHIEIRLPPRVEKWQVGVVIAHEMAHARGRKGDRSNEYWMRRSVRYGFTPAAKQYYQWCEALPLEAVKPKPKKPKPTPVEKVISNIERVEKNLNNWATKLKRAENAITKYNKQLKYYRKRLDAMANHE